MRRFDDGVEQGNEYHVRLCRRACGFRLIPTVHGRKFQVRGTLHGPLDELNVVTIWIVLRRERFPRFVTAYPQRPR